MLRIDARDLCDVPYSLQPRGGGKRHRELGGKKVGNYRPKAVTGEPVIEYPTEDLNPDDLPF